MSETLSPTLHEYVSGISAGIDQVTPERRAVLDRAVAFIRARPQSAALNFICTHNSRRSHLSHVWAHVAAYQCGLPSVQTFSGGTEATACNERTIAALKRAGFQISVAGATETKTADATNPIYVASFAKAAPPIELYSKVYSEPPNPSDGFAAMMCCSDVDERCPAITGAAERIALHYRDPKESDGTDRESATYDERCREIAIEMFYLMAACGK